MIRNRVIPAVTIGSGVAHGLILTWGVTVPVLHGGIFSVPLASNQCYGLQHG